MSRWKHPERGIIEGHIVFDGGDFVDIVQTDPKIDDSGRRTAGTVTVSKDDIEELDG